MYRFFFILLIFVAVSCGTQKQLQKMYIGKPESTLQERFGNPKTILKRDLTRVYIFEVEKKLESTEVNQGKLTLDPMITPKVKKTERYYFTVKDSVIINTKFEEEYER